MASTSKQKQSEKKVNHQVENSLTMNHDETSWSWIASSKSYSIAVIKAKFKDIPNRTGWLLLVFFMFAFAEELPTTAFGLILTQDLHVSPATQTLYYTAAFTTFSFQPLFAVFAQCLSMYTCLHQQYSAIFGIMIGGTMYILISIFEPNFAYLVVWTVALNVGLAFCNAVIDGVSVEISNDIKSINQPVADQDNNSSLRINRSSKESVSDALLVTNEENSKETVPFKSAASIQSLCYFTRSCGSLSSAALLIGLDNVGNYSVIAMTGFIYLGIIPLLWLLFRRTSSASKAHRDSEDSMHSLKDSVTDSEPMSARSELMNCVHVLSRIWKGVLFVFLLNLAPTFNDAFLNFLYSRTYFTTKEYRIFQFMSLCGSALGALFYFSCLAPRIRSLCRLSCAFVLMQILSCALAVILIPITNLSNSFVDDSSINGVVGIPFEYYLSIALLLNSLTSTLALMPQITLAAEMSPPKYETAVFATFTGMSHVGSLVSAAISTALLMWMDVDAGHWDNLSDYLIICSASGLIPLLALFVVHMDRK